jgi:NADH-quinone oxidoreductase subunit M
LDILGFFLAYAIKFHYLPYFGKLLPKKRLLLERCCQIMLKMGLYSVIRWQLPLLQLQLKRITILLGLGIAGVIYGSIVAFKTKDLKLLAVFLT